MTPTATLFLVLLAFLCGAGTAWRVWWELRRARRLNHELEELGSSLEGLAEKALHLENDVSSRSASSLSVSLEQRSHARVQQANIYRHVRSTDSAFSAGVRMASSYQFFVSSSVSGGDGPETYADAFGDDLYRALEHAGKVGVLPTESIEALRFWMERTPATTVKQLRRGDRQQYLLLLLRAWREDSVWPPGIAEGGPETGPVALRTT